MNGSPPPLTWHQVLHLHISVLSLLVVLAAGLYGLAAYWVSWPRSRTVAFLAGSLAAFIALGSAIGEYESVLFWAHMVQHLLLIMVAAPLMALGAPIELLREVAPGRWAPWLDTALDSAVARFLGHPVVDFALYACLIPVFHLTKAFDYTLMHPIACDAEHLYFLAVGYLFWRHVVGVEPTRHPMERPLRVIYVLLAAPVDTFTGLALISATHDIFPSYLMVMRDWGPTGLVDIHIGGAVMLLGGNSLSLLAVAAVVALAPKGRRMGAEPAAGAVFL